MRFSMKYMRSFWWLPALSLVISGLLLVVAGCGTKSGGGGGLNNAEIEHAIGARVNSFKAAVEAYNVQEMLDFLEKETEPEKKLAISEGGSTPYEKSYNLLKSELEEDEPNQVYWRKPVSEGGYGYTLTMELGTIAYSSVAASGAFATVPFTIKEEADGIPQQITDLGNMVCEMVKVGGVWSCRKMTINFNPVQAGASPAGLASLSVQAQTASKGGNNTARTGGFGFGRFDFE